MDVLIYYEHKAREMAVISALAALLERSGKRVKIAHLYHDTKIFRSVPPRLLAVPFFYGDYDPTLKEIFETFRGPILNLAFEQILYGIQKEMKEPRDIALSDRIRHCSWSEEFAKFLRDAGVRPDRIEKVGSPNFGLTLDPYIEIEPGREELAAATGADPRKPWILFTENYRWAFITKSQAARFASWGGTPGSIEEAIEYCRKCLRDLVLELGRLARGGFFRDREMIFRPRPSTTPELLDRFLRENGLEFPREVRIIKDFNARAWIRHADFIVSSFSTTICDAALMGKRIFLYSPYPYPDSLKYDWADLVDGLGSLDPEVLLDPGRGRPGALAAHVRRNYLAFGDPLSNLEGVCLRILEGEPRRSAAARVLGVPRIGWFEASRFLHRALYPILLRNRRLDRKWRIAPYLDDLITLPGERRLVAGWKRVIPRSVPGAAAGAAG